MGVIWGWSRGRMLRVGGSDMGGGVRRVGGLIWGGEGIASEEGDE